MYKSLHLIQNAAAQFELNLTTFNHQSTAAFSALFFMKLPAWNSYNACLLCDSKRQILHWLLQCTPSSSRYKHSLAWPMPYKEDNPQDFSLLEWNSPSLQTADFKCPSLSSNAERRPNSSIQVMKIQPWLLHLYLLYVLSLFRMLLLNWFITSQNSLIRHHYWGHSTDILLLQ